MTNNTIEKKLRGISPTPTANPSKQTYQRLASRLAAVFVAVATFGIFQQAEFSSIIFSIEDKSTPRTLLLPAQKSSEEIAENESTVVVGTEKDGLVKNNEPAVSEQNLGIMERKKYEQDYSIDSNVAQ